MAFAGGQPVKKNAEFLLIFPIYDNDGDLVTGAAALDSEISKDGEGFIDCENEAIEIGTSGIYKLTLTTEEMNADVVAVITKTSTEDAKTTATVIYTSEHQIVAMRGTDGAAIETKQDIIDSLADDIKSYLIDGGSIDLLIDAIKAKTDNIPASPAPASEYDTEMVRITANVATEAKQDIIDTIVDAIKVKTDTIGGAGAIAKIYILNDSVAPFNPIADADVWVTTDRDGLNVIASGKTDALGKVTFYLDVGTVHIWRQKSGWDFVNPDTEVVA